MTRPSFFCLQYSIVLTNITSCIFHFTYQNRMNQNFLFRKIYTIRINFLYFKKNKLISGCFCTSEARDVESFYILSVISFDLHNICK